MALTTLPTAALADDAVDNTKLDLAANYAFTGTVTGALANWTESSGNLLPDNASYGMYLGVSSATSSNLLDDYEIGSWTPTFNGASGGDVRGTYIKVGDVVTIYGHGWGITSTAVSATITNFPFGSPGGQTYISGTVGANTWTNNGASCWGYSANGVYVYDCVNKQEATAIAGNPKYISFSITYRTA
jgi:hypothetical protein